MITTNPLRCRVMIVAALLSTACRSTRTTLPPSSFVGCFALEYERWGPSRIIGDPIGSIPAPAVLVLTQAEPDQSVTRGHLDAFAARVLVDSDNTLFVPAYWKPLLGDSATVVVPIHVGLYGLGLIVHPQGDGLVGRAETYTDVVGATQATSKVTAHRIRCPRGA